jgi:hypothetical protein
MGGLTSQEIINLSRIPLQDNQIYGMRRKYSEYFVPIVLKIAHHLRLAEEETDRTHSRKQWRRNKKEHGMTNNRPE